MVEKKHGKRKYKEGKIFQRKIKNHSNPNSLLKTECKPKLECNPIQSNPIQIPKFKEPKNKD